MHMHVSVTSHMCLCHISHVPMQWCEQVTANLRWHKSTSWCTHMEADK
jgi:hypothetical protein